MTPARIVLAGLAFAVAVALIAAPFGLKPYGIYILTLWAVTTIAAMKAYRPRISPLVNLAR